MNQFQRAKLTPSQLATHDVAVKVRAIAYQKQWRTDNKDRLNTLQNQRRKENPERTKAHQVKFRSENREMLNAKQKERAKKNPKLMKSRFKRYYEKTKAIRHEIWAYKDALRRGCFVGDRKPVIEIYEKAVEMQRATGVRWSGDHIIPLALGGPHCAENMQAMPLDLNHTKSGNPFWVSPDGKYRDWRSVPRHLWPTQFKKIHDSVIAYSNSDHLHVLMSA